MALRDSRKRWSIVSCTCVTHVADHSRDWLCLGAAQREPDLTYCMAVGMALRVRPKRTIRPVPTTVLKFSEMRPLQGLQTQTTMRMVHRVAQD
jgi:hypothetical protein